nr:hypothetical protein [Tanacetum cinerariifolium]
MALYLNEVNVVNENKLPSAVKVVGQLLRKTYKGKVLVELYTVQPPNTASVHLGKAIRKRKKKAAKRLQSRKTRILFDADGDDDRDIMFISLEDWENTKSNKTRKRKHANPLSEIAKSEFPLVDIARPADTDWAIASSSLCNFVMRESDIPGWVCNGVRFGVITLYDSMGVSVKETKEWWSDIRIAFKTRIPQYLVIGAF